MKDGNFSSLPGQGETGASGPTEHRGLSGDQSKVQSIDNDEAQVSMIRTPSLMKLDDLRKKITDQIQKKNKRAVSVITVQGDIHHHVQRIQNVADDDMKR